MPIGGERAETRHQLPDRRIGRVEDVGAVWFIRDASNPLGPNVSANDIGPFVDLNLVSLPGKHPCGDRTREARPYDQAPSSDHRVLIVLTHEIVLTHG